MVRGRYFLRGIDSKCFLADPRLDLLREPLELFASLPLDEITKRIPLGRPGKAEEVAATVLFAVKNGFLNGAVCGVDGGSVRTP